MKRLIVGFVFLAPIAWAGWQLGGMLSTDALGMALGVLFGIMAGIPMALIALAADRRVRVEHIHRIEIAQPPKTPQVLILPARPAIMAAIEAKAQQRPALPAKASNSD